MCLFHDRITSFCHGSTLFSDGMRPFCHGKVPFFDGMYSFHDRINPFCHGNTLFFDGMCPFHDRINPFCHGNTLFWVRNRINLQNKLNLAHRSKFSQVKTCKILQHTAFCLLYKSCHYGEKLAALFYGHVIRKTGGFSAVRAERFGTACAFCGEGNIFRLYTAV